MWIVLIYKIFLRLKTRCFIMFLPLFRIVFPREKAFQKNINGLFHLIAAMFAVLSNGLIFFF